MAGATLKKRLRNEAPKSKASRPSKKQRKLLAYHSDSDESEGEDGQDFKAVNLLDSEEEDIHNAVADDGAASEPDSDSDLSSSTSEAEIRPRKAAKAPPQKNKLATDAPPESDDSEDDNGSDEDSDDQSSDAGSEDAGESDGDATAMRRPKSKRTDPSAFATSLSKILSTKLSTSRRADPVLARSAEAQEAGRQAVDAALETKARKKLREQKRLAMEKGRVRDVLVATSSVFTVDPATGNYVAEGEARETTAQVLETERRLRKVAQKGVVQLFNAFRTAQVKALEAERATKKEGVLGMDRKKEKVTEMSKKGFLDLIASGGGGLKKGALEEA